MHVQGPVPAYLGAMVARYALPFLLFTVVLLGACRKDRDEDAPKVKFLEPAASSMIQVPDTIVVRVEVSDERTVERVTIALNDVNGVPVVPTISVQVNAASATIVRALPITSERLLSGIYTLAVTARDGTNEARAFRTINLQAAPLRSRALYITPPVGYPPPVPVWRIDSTGALSQYVSLQEFGGGAIDPDRLYLAGITIQGLQGIPQTTGGAALNIPNTGPAGATAPFFLGPTADRTDGRFYFGNNEGFIRGYNQGATQAFTAQSPIDLRSLQTAVVGSVLASAARHQVLNTWQLVTHAMPSGAVLAQFPMDLEPVQLLARNSQQLFIFGNRNGTGVVQERNVAQGGATDLQSFNQGPISAVAVLNSSTAVVAVPGMLMRFNAGSNSLNVLAQGLTAQSLAYDPASGILYAGVDEQLLAMDPLTGSSTVLFSFPHPVGRILPLLNR